MKTKIVYIVLSLILGNGAVEAQTNFYTQPGTALLPDSTTYRWDRSSYKITLYNTENVFTNVPWLKKDGSKVSEDVGFGRVHTFARDSWTRPKALEIVDNAFTAAERASLKGQRLWITMYLDSDTGIVREVQFEFFTSSDYVYFPPQRFRAIEVELKREIWFTITPAGKELNYCICFWGHDFDKN